MSLTLILALLLQVIPLAVAAPQAALAATLNPGCTNGVGDADALISAITTANTNNQADTILLAFGCTYTLTAINNNTFGPNGLPAILNDGASHGLTLLGNGATIARSSAIDTPDFRLFYVSPDSSLSLKNITLLNGRAVGFAGGNGAAENVGPNNGGAGGGSAGVGGAIFNNNGNLSILNSALSNNQAVGGNGGNGIFGWMGAGGGGGLGGPGGSGSTAPNGPTSGGGGGGLGAGGNGSNSELVGGVGGVNGGGVGGTTSGGGNGLNGAGGGGSSADIVHTPSTEGNGNGGFGGGAGGGGTAQTSGFGIRLDGQAGYGGGNGARFGAGNGGNGLGGAVAAVGGQTTLIGSTFNGNSTLGGTGGSNESGPPGAAGTGFGGAIMLYADSAGPGISAVISNSTVSGNTSAGRGGGILFMEGGAKSALSRVFIDQSTITLNTAAERGGGVAQDFYGHVTTLNPDNLVSTFNGVVLRSSIVAGNTNTSDARYTDLFSTITSAGTNVIGNVDGAFNFQSIGDFLGTTTNPLNPFLGPLADNGGSTLTHALLNGSPAIAKGLYPCPDVDQRGFPRSVPSGENNNTRCSIGGYESSSPFNTGVGVIFVNSTATTVANDGLCTLIEAITAANTSSASGAAAGECAANATSAKWIYLQPGATYTLSSINNNTLGPNGLPAITSNIKIIGNGATIARSTAVGTPDFRLFYTAPSSNFTLSNATVTNGRAPSGGALYHDRGVLQIENSTFSSNAATADGGAIFISFSGSADNFIFNSTFGGNSATSLGGAIFVNGTTISEPSLVIRNSTFSGNSAGVDGGGISKNTTSVIEMGGTLIAGNTAGSAPDANGSYTSYGYNLIGNANGATGFANAGDQAGTSASPINPQLGPLQNNEGPVATFALLPNSPAIGTSEVASSCATYDQRGVRRPQTLHCSIGAFEPVNAQIGPTFVVNTVEDSDGDACAVGFCSLRAAINEANALPPNPATPYRINFNMGATGIYTLLLKTRLPALRNPMIIDGTSQSSGVVGKPAISIAWDAYPSSNPQCSSTSYFYCHGPIFQISAGTTTIKGLQISGALDPIFVNSAQVIGIYIQGPGGNHIEDNVFVDALAQAITIDDSPNNVIKNNLIDIASIGFSAIAAFPYRYLDGTQRSVQGTIIQGNTIRSSLGYPTLNFANGAITLPDATNSLIGGLGPDEGNLIESGQFGISIKGNGNRLLSNQIYAVRAGAISTPTRRRQFAQGAIRHQRGAKCGQ